MSHFRIGVGKISQEGNSFAALETSLGDFESYGGLLVGHEILDQPERRDEVTGFVKAIESGGEDFEVIPLISTEALPSGSVTVDAVRSLDETLRGVLREAGELDGILFSLHGAMASAAIPDLDGHYLEIIRREKGEDIPMVCTLDCHANVTQQMADLATALVAYRTHPHIDLVETGMRAGEILLRTLQGELRPTMAWQKVPLVFPPPDDGTHSGPLKELFDTFVSWDDLDGVIACSLCACQCWLDIPELGLAAIAVTDDDYPLARRLVRQLAVQAWDARERLLPEKMLSPEAAVRAAAAAPGTPIVITDSADVIGGGAPGDTTELLKALLEYRDRVDGLILADLPDPEAVQRIIAAPSGATVTLDVGGKRDARFSQPLRVTGRVLSVTDGVIEDVGRFGNEPTIDVGHIACLAIDNIRLVLHERPIMGPQPSLFRKVGIDPYQAKIVVLKTGIGFKVTYAVAKAVFRADCPGATSYNLSNYEYGRAPRPLYPLDVDMDWEPEV
jgi:microcystin degradation protein MlrC